MAKLNVQLPSNGLVADRPGEYVDAQSATGIQNMEHNRSIIRKRIGALAVGASLGERIQAYFELQVGNETRLFRVGPTKVQVLNKATGAWSSVAHAALTGTTADQVAAAFPLLGGVKIATFTNGIDAIRKCGITGADAVLGGAPPIARYMQAFGGYLVLAYITTGGNTFYSRVQWCDTGDCELWTPAGDNNAGSQDLLEDPDDITGLGVFGSFLTVHKAHSIYLGQLVSTASVFQFSRRATGVGAAAGATIANIPSGEQIFLAADGLHLFNGITAPLIESPVQDELREEMNPAYLYKAQAVFVAELDEYWVCVPTGSDTEPGTVYKYNWRTKQCYKDRRANLSALGVYLNTQEDTWDDRALAWDADTSRWNSVSNLSLNPVVIFGDATGASTSRSANTTDDAGVAVDGIWDTKDFTAADAGIPDVDRLMRWRGLQMWAKGSAMTVYYSTDGGTTWLPATTLALGSDYPNDAAPLQAYFDVVSTRLRLRFRNQAAGQGFTVKKYQLDAVPREARR